ncbi:hypothetical protein KL86DPRO_40138 [uncultured delta proteobacterium]|uniref:Uncharacterized protein n=1 Tax=uncultured delta proteobacterium TaxID=34034 RepID=A0A212KAD8_9DELT|nr:hypothetical protein KL86DPRO_40138 [uncultured delta proteobacterium]
MPYPPYIICENKIRIKLHRSKIHAKAGTGFLRMHRPAGAWIVVRARCRRLLDCDRWHNSCFPQ